MIKLIKHNESRFTVIYLDEQYSDLDLLQAELELKGVGVEPDQVSLALTQMHSMGHDIADFGVNRSFIFTDIWDKAKYLN